MEGQLHLYRVRGKHAPSGGGMGGGYASTTVEAVDEKTAKTQAAQRQSVNGVEFTPQSVEHICCQ